MSRTFRSPIKPRPHGSSSSELGPSRETAQVAHTRLGCARCGFTVRRHWAAPTYCPRCLQRGQRIELAQHELWTHPEGRGGLELHPAGSKSRSARLTRNERGMA